MTSPGKPRAILLTHRIPYPPDKGDKIRSWRLLNYLAERYDVALGCFVDDEDDWQHTDAIEAVCETACFRPLRARTAVWRSVRALKDGEPITLGRYRDPVLAEWLRGEQAKSPAVCVGFSAGVMPYLLGGSALGPAPAPVLADLCDADSAKWTAYAEGARGPKGFIYAREGRLLAKTEAQITRVAARTFLVTPEEAAMVEHLPGANRSGVDYYRNGVDTDDFAPGIVAPAPGGADIVLTGAMDYRPNADGARWFAEKALPMIREARPGTTFAIVGARPTRAVRALAARPGIVVTGRVPDIRPWLEAARVAVAPLAVARGVQNKVLEAMAMGTPLVASPSAAAGTTAIPGEHVLTAESPGEVAEAVSSLLTDEVRAARMAQAARELAVSRFGWAAALSRFGDALPR